MKQASDLVKLDIINRLDNNLKVVSVDSQNVTFKCLKWFKLYGFVIFNNEELKPTEINGNTLTFDTEIEFTKQSQFSLKLPLFLNGTLSNTKMEWDKFEKQERKKLPFIWLTSPTQITKERTESTVLNYDLNLWFVHWSDWSKLNVDRQNEAIKPLSVLVDAFLSAIENNQTFDSYSGVQILDFPKFGVIENESINKSIFNSTLSGIELKVNVNAYNNECNC